MLIKEAFGDYGVQFACPHCNTPIDLSVTGSKWQINSSRDVADRMVLQIGAKDREELHVLILNTKNIVLAQDMVYVGNVSGSLVRVGELFKEAIKLNASGIIVVHNHPSGDYTPSPDDLHLTNEIVAAGKLLDIDVLDHIIVNRDSFTSLRDRGVKFTVR